MITFLEDEVQLNYRTLSLYMTWHISSQTTPFFSHLVVESMCSLENPLIMRRVESQVERILALSLALDHVLYHQRSSLAPRPGNRLREWVS